MDVLGAAWKACGQPTAGLGAFSATGTCARCGELGPVAPAGHAVSHKWTGWDTWQTAINPRLCRPCVWGYLGEGHRAGHFLITAAPSMARLDPAGLHRALEQPLGTDAAVVVVLRPGRKHVLPTAQWGKVTVEDAHLIWTRTDADRLQAMTRLRELGFGPRMLHAETPPFTVLARMDAAGIAEAIALWAALADWRRRSLWLEVGLRATIPASRKATTP